jgi:hypothetical protein
VLSLAAASGIIDRRSLPPLPPKTRGRGRLAHGTVGLREAKLGEYLTALLQQAGATDSVSQSKLTHPTANLTVSPQQSF